MQPTSFVSSDPAGEIVRLLNPTAWLPAESAQWIPLIEGLLAAFLRKFDPDLLKKMLNDQQRLDHHAPSGKRAVLLASECTAFHKLCQILARNPMVPRETRDLLVSLETLPPSSIPESARSKAVNFASRAWKQLGGNLRCTRLGRGSVADVFKIRSAEVPLPIVLKIIRSDSVSRVRREAEILSELAEEAAEIGILLGPKFEHALSEALQDAADSLLREIDFPGESGNLEEASLFYAQNERIRIPESFGPESESGLFMELVEGIPLFENSLAQDERREIARQLFRAVILEPLFSGLPETIFHGDPHAGNILLQACREKPVRIILLDWSQAGRLPDSVRHGLIELCLNCLNGEMPSREVIEHVVGRPPPKGTLSIPKDGNPLSRALEIIQQLAIDGMKVPLSLLLLRKSLLTIEAIARQLNPDFDSWKETVVYSGWVIASETPFRIFNLALPWLDIPSVYRSGISTKALLAMLVNKFVRSHNFSLTFPLALCDSLIAGLAAKEVAAVGGEVGMGSYGVNV